MSQAVERDGGPHGRFKGEWVKAKRIVSMYYTSPSYKTIRREKSEVKKKHFHSSVKHFKVKMEYKECG